MVSFEKLKVSLLKKNSSYKAVETPSTAHEYDEIAKQIHRINDAKSLHRFIMEHDKFRFFEELSYETFVKQAK